MQPQLTVLTTRFYSVPLQETDAFHDRVAEADETVSLPNFRHRPNRMQIMQIPLCSEPDRDGNSEHSRDTLVWVRTYHPAVVSTKGRRFISHSLNSKRSAEETGAPFGPRSVKHSFDGEGVKESTYYFSLVNQVPGNGD